MNLSVAAVCDEFLGKLGDAAVQIVQYHVNDCGARASPGWDFADWIRSEMSRTRASKNLASILNSRGLQIHIEALIINEEKDNVIERSNFLFQYYGD